MADEAPRPSARRRAAWTALAAGIVAWTVLAHHLAPWIHLDASGPWSSPLLWALFLCWGGAGAATLRWGDPRMLADALAVAWLAWFGFAGYLVGGWPGVGALGGAIAVLPAGAVAYRIGRWLPGPPTAWWAAGVGLAAPFVVLGPLSLRWLVVESSRGWPIQFLAMVDLLPFFKDAAALLAAFLVASVAAVGCMGRGQPGA